MGRKSILSLVIGMAAVATALPVVAATSASTRVTGLTFELVDLDMSDGVAASITWTSATPLTQVDNYFGQQVQLLPVGDGTTTWSVTFADMATASGSSDPGFASQASFAGGAATATTADTGALAQTSTTLGGQQLSSFAMIMGDFVLSANTELRITGFAESSISGAGSANTIVPAGVDSPLGVVFSQASTFLEVALGTQTFNQTLNGLSYAPNGDHSLYPVADYSSSLASSFSLGWRNTTGDDQAGYFSLLAQSSLTQLEERGGGGPGPAPVPEPSTWLLMALGLGAAAAMRHRRTHG